MTLSPKDRRLLYSSFGMAIALIISGGLLVWWAKSDMKRAETERQQIGRRSSEINSRLRQVNIEEQEIRAKAAFFRTLEQRRIIGPEQRLDWIELIDQIREQRRLFEIDYDISPIKAGGATLAEFKFNTSQMNFHLPLLHEGDLLGFLQDLQQRAPAIVKVRECEIVRAPARVDRQAGDANLDARCKLHWTTIALVKAGGSP